MAADSKHDNLVVDRLDREALVRVLREAIAEVVRQVIDDLRVQHAARPRYVTLAQAHTIYGIAPRTLRQHISAGRLGAYAPGRTKLLIDTAELEAFIRASAVDRDRDIDAIAEEAIAEIGARK